MNTWIFQANPDRFDVDAYLQRTRGITWSVAKAGVAHEMRIGDRVYIAMRLVTLGRGHAAFPEVR
jgi:hypothetical protein